MLGSLCIRLFELLGLVEVRRGQGEDQQYTDCSNMTLINLALKWLGPTHEQSLAVYLLISQVSFLCYFGLMICNRVEVFVDRTLFLCYHTLPRVTWVLHITHTVWFGENLCLNVRFWTEVAKGRFSNSAHPLFKNLDCPCQSFITSRN